MDKLLWQFFFNYLCLSFNCTITSMLCWFYKIYKYTGLTTFTGREKKRIQIYTKCLNPFKRVKLYFSGYASGQHFNEFSNRFGGPANFLCLPRDPELSNMTAQYSDSHIYGTEYEESTLRSDALNEDVPCALCKSTNTHSSVMIPGRKSCYPGWKVEYNGFLASDHYGFSASSYICIDKDPEYVPGGQKDENGRRLYMTVIKCGALSCPPYKDNHMVNCVVCSQWINLNKYICVACKQLSCILILSVNKERLILFV
jgi:hypothetical protein